MAAREDLRDNPPLNDDGTASYYPVDMWLVNSTHAGICNIAQVASLTPGGSPNRIRITVTTADASVGAADVMYIRHPIEGLRMADLRIGTAAASQVAFQFGVRAPAGTYAVMLTNATTNRFYVAPFTIAAGEANTDVVKNITLKLDTTGTWANDNTVGMYLQITLMAGATYQTAGVNAWTGGTNLFAGTTQFNFMGTNGNVFELFDVGMYQNVAPSFQAAEYTTDLLACMRYYRKTTGEPATEPTLYGYGDVGASVGICICYPVPMRVAPSANISGTWATNGTAVQPTIAGSNNASYSIFVTSNVTGRVTFQPNNSGRIGFSARM
jgi:hypothetical protein